MLRQLIPSTTSQLLMVKKPSARTSAETMFMQKSHGKATPKIHPQSPHVSSYSPFHAGAAFLAARVAFRSHPVPLNPAFPCGNTRRCPTRVCVEVRSVHTVDIRRPGGGAKNTYSAKRRGRARGCVRATAREHVRMRAPCERVLYASSDPISPHGPGDDLNDKRPNKPSGPLGVPHPCMVAVGTRTVCPRERRGDIAETT